MSTFQTLIASDAGDGYFNVNDSPSWHQSGDGNHNDFVGGGRIGLVFTNVTISRNNTITSATLDLYGFGTSPGTALIKMLIKGFAQDNAPLFDSNGDNEPGLRPLTNASQEWDFIFPFSNARRSSTDLTSIIQEIVNRSGWSSGNNMGFQISDNGTVSGNMASTDYAGSTTNCAQLTINYNSNTSIYGNYGFRISQAGFDVKTATDSQLVITSKLGAYKIQTTLKGSTTQSIPASTTSTIQIAHNLGYIPAYDAWFLDDKGNWHTVFATYQLDQDGFNIFAPSGSSYADSTNLNIVIENSDAGSAHNVTIYYIIFLNPM